MVPVHPFLAKKLDWARLLNTSHDNSLLFLFLIFLLDFGWTDSERSSRADDTKGMKSVIIDWIMPSGQALLPPLNCRTKFECGFHHKVTGSLLCPAGVNWGNLE
jgi:hypothetical protein